MILLTVPAWLVVGVFVSAFASKHVVKDANDSALACMAVAWPLVIAWFLFIGAMILLSDLARAVADRLPG